MQLHGKRRGRAWFHWFAESDSPKERRLILKLDLLIVPYAFLSYWVYYIDDSNISEPNVSNIVENTSNSLLMSSR